MNKSLYRKIVFGMHIMICFLLTIIALKLNILQSIASDSIFNFLCAIFTNTYFSGISCSIIAVVIIYFAQVKYSKRMLKRDFRCNEVIRDIYFALETYIDISAKIPKTIERSENEEFLANKKRNALRFYEFYKHNKAAIDIIAMSFVYENNDLLIESVQSCFLINLNFKLLSIINNVKNRLSSLRPKYEDVSTLYKNYEADKTDETLVALGDKLFDLFVDLKCMTTYWKQLLDYLEYDPRYVKLFVELYNSKYSIKEDLDLPLDIEYSRIHEIDKAARRQMLLDQVHQFWSK